MLGTIVVGILLGEVVGVFDGDGVGASVGVILGATEAGAIESGVSMTAAVGDCVGQWSNSASRA